MAERNSDYFIGLNDLKQKDIEGKIFIFSSNPVDVVFSLCKQNTGGSNLCKAK